MFTRDVSANTSVQSFMKIKILFLSSMDIMKTFTDTCPHGWMNESLIGTLIFSIEEMVAKNMTFLASDCFMNIFT